MVELLFEDFFTLTRLDPDACSEQYDMYMQLDVNTEIYPLHVGDKFMMVLSPTLSLGGTPDTGYFLQGGRKSLADKFEYVMHGKPYKISEEVLGGNSVKVEVYSSFGGLLMMLKGGSLQCSSVPEAFAFDEESVNHMPNYSNQMTLQHI